MPEAGSRRLLGVLAILTLIAGACASRFSNAQLRAYYGQQGSEVAGALTAGTPGRLADATPGTAAPGVDSGSATVGGSAGASDSPGSSRNGAAGSSGDGAQVAKSAVAGSAGAQRSEIVLGSFGTGSGPIGAQLADATPGIRAWVADVNARGGLNGHHVRVVIGDDGGDPTRALALAKHMVEEDKVLAFYGLFGATTEASVAPYLEQQGVPVIGGVPAPPPDTSPVFFNPEAGTDGTYRGHLVSIVHQTNVRKLALLYCTEADTCSKGAAVHRAYAPKLGITITYEARVSLAQPDYTAEVIAARNSGAEGLLITLDYASVLRVIRSAKRQGWNPVFAGNGATYNDDFIKNGGADAEGVIAVASVPPFNVSPKMRPYVDAVNKYVPGSRLGDFGAEMWVAGKLWERIGPALAEPPTRQQIFDALYSLHDETLGGLTPPLTFPHGAKGEVNMCEIPMRVVGGRWTAPLGDGYLCAP